ncbi:MAG: hypothetical protein ABJI69_13505 [Balneola sp.]
MNAFDKVDYDNEEDVNLITDLIVALGWSPSLSVNRGAIKKSIRNPALQIAILKAIMQGYTTKEVKKDGDGNKIDWSGLLEKYRDVFGGSRWEVWNNTPFVFVIESMNEYRKHRAEKNISKAIVNSPSKEVIESWQSDIKGEEPEKSKTDLMFENLSPEEIEKVKESSRKAYFGNS